MDGVGAPRPKQGGPMRPGTGAAWAHLFWPPGLRFLVSSTPSLLPSKIMTPVKGEVIWTSFDYLKLKSKNPGFPDGAGLIP